VNGCQTLAVFVLSAALAGCQAILPESRLSTSEDRFQEAWSLYARCLKSSDLIETERTAGLLRRVVRIIDGATPSLPDLVGRFVDPPPSRLAAEPKAMWAACALHAARAAVIEYHAPAAIDLLQAVVAAYPEGESSYYVAQARMNLSHFDAFADWPDAFRLVVRR